MRSILILCSLQAKISIEIASPQQLLIHVILSDFCVLQLVFVLNQCTIDPILGFPHFQMAKNQPSFSPELNLDVLHHIYGSLPDLRDMINCMAVNKVWLTYF